MVFALDHVSGFLLSLMDGTLTVEAILDVAGLPRLLALRHLRNLLERASWALRRATGASGSFERSVVGQPPADRRDGGISVEASFVRPKYASTQWQPCSARRSPTTQCTRSIGCWPPGSRGRQANGSRSPPSQTSTPRGYRAVRASRRGRDCRIDLGGRRRGCPCRCDLDCWIRHRLRALQLKHWKRGPTIFRELRARGACPTTARSEWRATPAAGGETRGWPSTSHCRTSSSTVSGFRGSSRDLNSPNRRMRTRLSGGVAGIPRS